MSQNKNWQIKPLGEVCKLKNGFAFKSDNYLDKGIPVIRISDIKDGLIVPRNTVHVAENSIYDSYIINENEIIVAMSGATTGKFGIYKSKDKAYQNQRVGKFDILDKTILDNNFLLNQLHSLKRQIEKDAYGGAQPNISSKKIEEMKIVLPPLETQQAIVSKIEELFSELDKGIEDLKTAQQQLKTYRQSVLKWAFEGKLTNENVKDGELPKGWEWTTIGNIFEVHIGSTPKRNIPEYWGGTINWVSSGEIAFCNITKTKEQITKIGLDNTSCKVHPVGTVIIAMIGEGKTRGQAAILKIEASHNQNTAAIRVDNNSYLSELLYYYLFLKYQDNRKVGSGNNQKALNKERVKGIELPFLPIEEQHRMVQEIESRLSVADKMEESIAQSLQQAEALRQSILKKAFSGELVEL
jgi:type I restriction enzyme S subunit